MGQPKRHIFLFTSLAAVIMLGLFVALIPQTKIFAVVEDVFKWGWAGNSETAGSGGVSLISFGSTSAPTSYSVHIETNPTDCPSNQCPVTGTAWLGSYENDSGDPHPIGVLEFPEDLTTIDHPTFVNTEPYWDPGTKKIHGWARLRSIYDEGSDVGNNYDWGWVKLNGTNTDNNEEYSVYYDSGTNRLSGWAWSGNGTSDGTTVTVLDGTGLGWFQFDLIIEDTAGKPYLYVQEGDIYSGRAIIGESGLPENATYLILAEGTITDFTSEQGVDYEEQNFAELDLPTESTGQIYRSNIADIDVPGLEAGKYGNEVVELTGTFAPGTALGNKVYVQDSDLTIDNDVTITHTLSEPGNGTIIVKGDLYIDEDINYLPTPTLNNINELPSAAWIVLGDIIIDDSVRNLSGVFISLKNGAGAGGKISTGTGIVPLTVSGAMIAYEFDFQREGVQEEQAAAPSEKIIYDGRLLANSPPGLQDFAKTLPELESIAPHEAQP